MPLAQNAMTRAAIHLALRVCCGLYIAGMRNGFARLKTILAIGVALAIMASSAGGGVSAKGGKWSVKAPIPTPRYGLAVGVVNGVLYAVGGDRGRGPAVTDRYLTLVEAYNPATNSWTTKAPMPTGRWGLAVGVVKGTLFAVGGVGRPPPGLRQMSVVLSTVEAYDPITNSWATKAPMPTPRSYLTVGVVNGILYALGGARSPYPQVGDILSSVEAYDPSTNAWTTTAPIPTMRHNFHVGVVNEIMYLLGTAGPGSDLVSAMEAYDPVTNGWKPKASIPKPWLVLAVGVTNQTLYAVATRLIESASEIAVSTVQAYDVATDTWTMRAPMPTPRYNTAVGVANGILYLVGGESPGRVENPSPRQPPWVSDLKPDLLAFEP